MPIGTYRHPDELRYPRTQSRIMAECEWEEREEGLPRPLWKDYAAGVGTVLFILCVIVIAGAI